jgi:hypothetical protein
MKTLSDDLALILVTFAHHLIRPFRVGSSSGRPQICTLRVSIKDRGRGRGEVKYIFVCEKGEVVGNEWLECIEKRLTSHQQRYFREGRYHSLVVSLSSIDSRKYHQYEYSYCSRLTHFGMI